MPKYNVSFEATVTGERVIEADSVEQAEQKLLAMQTQLLFDCDTMHYLTEWEIFPEGAERIAGPSLELIQHVRETADIAALIREAGVELFPDAASKDPASHLVGRCPFCTTPSAAGFRVAADRKFFHCFDCNVSGSAIDFVMVAGGLSFHDAVQKLAKRSASQAT